MDRYNLDGHIGIPAVTVGFNTLLDGDKSRNRIIEQSDFFMNMFWAGYHMYKNPKKQESNEMEA
ncbi:hypothetical protein CEN49_20760 [Fischerella thermalis CCMEE 5273]|nr:hypothetical protein CEN49_20760 [Fischerella thermalis CCMEE 5273]